MATPPVPQAGLAATSFEHRPRAVWNSDQAQTVRPSNTSMVTTLMRSDASFDTDHAQLHYGVTQQTFLYQRPYVRMVTAPKAKALGLQRDAAPALCTICPTERLVTKEGLSRCVLPAAHPIC